MKNITVVGNGVEGWLAAALLAKETEGCGYHICLVYNSKVEPLDTAGGISPLALACNRRLGLNEKDFLTRVGGGFSWGRHYKSFAHEEQDFFFSHSPPELMYKRIELHHYLAKLHVLGGAVNVDEYSLAASLARRYKFVIPPKDAKQPLADLLYGYNVNFNKYAALMQELAVSYGVESVDGSIESVVLDPQGNIQQLNLSGARQWFCDFIIDCADIDVLKSSLGVVKNKLDAQFSVDRCASWYVPADFPILPGEVMTAHKHGVLRKTPLPSATFCEFYFSSALLSDEEISSLIQFELMFSSADAPVFSPHHTFVVDSFWTKNLLSLGLGAAQLEDFCMGRLDLFYAALFRFMDFLPDGQNDAVLAREYNKLTAEEYTQALDFSLAHYAVVKRKNSSFWRREPVGDAGMARRQKLFNACGETAFFDSDKVRPAAWAFFWLGQDVWPAQYNPFVDDVSLEEIVELTEASRNINSDITQKMPLHQTYLDALI